MKLLVITILCLYTGLLFCQQPGQRNKELIKIDTATLDLKLFAENIIGKETDEFEKAKKLLYWLSSNFEWKSTDYKTRTVKEIIARNGGNCFELAKVYMALIQNAGITYRAMCEINIHPITPNRQVSAASMVKEKGNSFSVFGLQHNDHRWVEIFDKKTNSWQPADPSMGVIGLSDWLKARVWFGDRKTIDTAITNQMIVPFAIFVTGSNRAPEESRTAHYLINSFNDLYGGKLKDLPEWDQWVSAVNSLTNVSRDAFLGKVNLHTYQQEISKLASTYEQLKISYKKKS